MNENNAINNNKLDSKNKRVLIVAVIFGIVAIFLTIFVCFILRPSDKKEQSKKPDKKVDDSIEYVEPTLLYDYNDIGKVTTGIKYNKDKAKVGVLYDDNNEKILSVSLNDKDIVAFNDEDSLYGIYQITNNVVVIKNKGTDLKEVYIYNFDGKIIMNRELSIKDMKIENFSISGNIIKVDYKGYDGNICDMTLSNDLVVVQSYTIFYDSSENKFSYDLDESSTKTVADLKATC